MFRKHIIFPIKKIFTRLKAQSQVQAMRDDSIVFQRSGTPFVGVGGDSITAILTVYKRPGYLRKQIDALRAQTAPPAQIWVWCNDGGEPVPDFSTFADRVIVSNFNWKFFGRFTLAGLAQTDYVAFFDDDILPQPMWFENCLNTVKEGNDCILGGKGIILPAAGGYAHNRGIGWSHECLSVATAVDLVGHAWFARKAHYLHMWREEPYSFDNAEDMHLSYTALKYGGVKTMVPPHPPENRRLWSCDPDFGRIAGSDKVATFKRTDHLPIRTAAVQHYRQNGWQIVATDSDN